MWIGETAPERIAELFQNYERALQVFGKGSEGGSRNGSTQSRPEPDPTKAHEYSAQPGEAEWGC